MSLSTELETKFAAFLDRFVAAPRDRKLTTIAVLRACGHDDFADAFADLMNRVEAADASK
jgi:hypothetical protein